MAQVSEKAEGAKPKAKSDPLKAAAKLGFSKKLSKRLLKQGEAEFKKSLTAVRKARKAGIGLEDARQKLLELGRDGLEQFAERMKAYADLPAKGRKRQGDVAVGDVVWNNIANLQGFSWAVVTVGTKIVARPDLLVVYNCELKGPIAQLPRRNGKGYVGVPTHGLGLVLGATEYASFGALPPKGKPHSMWRPVYIEGDPDGRSAMTAVKLLAEDIDADGELRSVIERLGYDLDRRGGVPVSFIKRALNDTLKLGGLSGSPGWESIAITSDSDEKEISKIKDEAARERIAEFWFDDEDDSDEDDWEDGEELFDWEDDE